MDGVVHFLQISKAQDVFSVGSSHVQITDPVPDFLAAQVLYVQVHNFTGSVQTDKQHVHKLYSSMKLLMH